MTLSGAARVVDGDTLAFGADHVRILGIDAPEIGQPCRREGASWDCGAWARAAVAEHIAGRPLTCEGDSRDRYGRLLATCTVGGSDLGQVLVRDGVARAYARYSAAYVPDEAAALADGRGLWAGTVEAPWDWRRADDAGEGTAGCRIKGNVSANGRIFHSPGQADYAATRIDTGNGERWFCTPAEATAAGWRAARR